MTVGLNPTNFSTPHPYFTRSKSKVPLQNLNEKTILSLPPEILIEISNYLNLGEILKLSECCSYFFDVVRDNGIVKRRFNHMQGLFLFRNPINYRSLKEPEPGYKIVKTRAYNMEFFETFVCKHRCTQDWVSKEEKALKQVTRISKVEFHATTVSVQAIKKLGKMREFLPVKSLQICSDAIDGGMFSNLTKNMVHTKVLDLSVNPLPLSVFNLGHLPELESLYLKCINNIDQTLDTIKSKRIRTLHILNSQRTSSESLVRLNTLPLQTLSLCWNHGALRALPKMHLPKLRSVSLNQNTPCENQYDLRLNFGTLRIFNKALKDFVSRHPLLNRVKFERLPVDDQILSLLPKEVVEISLPYTNLTLAGVKKISRATFPNLKNVNISGLDIQAQDVVDHFKEQKNIDVTCLNLLNYKSTFPVDYPKHMRFWTGFEEELDSF